MLILTIMIMLGGRCKSYLMPGLLLYLLPESADWFRVRVTAVGTLRLGQACAAPNSVGRTLPWGMGASF